MEQNDNTGRSEPQRERAGLLTRIKQLFIVLMLLILLIITAGIAAGYFYGDEVKTYVIEQLNKQLNTRVIIEPQNIQFSLLKNFPSASLEFRHVLALDATPGKDKKDTLFEAGLISLQFNIVDIFNKNYRIKKIDLSDVIFKMAVYKNGTDNYHFWKRTSDNSSGNFSFALEKIKLKNIRLQYTNKQNLQSHQLVITKGFFSGNFTDKSYKLNTNLQLYINHLSADSTTYLKDNTSELKADIFIDNNTDTYSFEAGKLKIADLSFDIAGQMGYRDTVATMDIKLKGRDLDIQSALSLLPAKYRNRADDYSSEGNFFFDAAVKGSYSKGQTPSVTAQFGVRDGEIKEKQSGLKLKNVQVEGTYTSQNNSKLIIKQFSGQLDEGKLNGQFTIENFKKPFLDLSINADMGLDNFQKLAKVDTIETIDGRATVNLIYRGRLPEEKNGKVFIAENLKNAETSGSLNLTDVNFRLKNSKHTFDSINGVFMFNNNDISVDDFRGNISGSDFVLKGFLKNILPYVFSDNEDLSIEAKLKCNRLDLDNLLIDEDKTSKRDTVYELKFSEHLRLDLNSHIHELHFRRFSATDVKGQIILEEKKMTIDPVSFSTMDGEITGAGLIDGTRENRIIISCKASLDKININMLFSELENFGQSTFTDRNIKGTLTAGVQYSSEWNSKLEANLDRVYATADIKIEHGEILNFEPLKDFSKFINVSDLSDIKFATLENQIEIKNQTIFIPKMDLKNNALNLICSGKHKFNNEIDYHIQLLMSELLAKKAGKARKENEEFGEVEPDGSSRSLFISMSGTVDKPVIRYDKRGMVQKVKDDIRKEKENLKNILREEFGWFKKDSIQAKTQKKEEKKKDDKFIIKWDEGGKKEKKEDEDF